MSSNDVFFLWNVPHGSEILFSKSLPESLFPIYRTLEKNKCRIGKKMDV